MARIRSQREADSKVTARSEAAEEREGVGAGESEISGGRGESHEEIASKITWIAIPRIGVVGGAVARYGPDPKQVQKETHDGAETSSWLHADMKAVVSRDMEKEVAMSRMRQ